MSKDSALSRALAHIDELETKIATFREIGTKIMAVHNSLSTWPSMADCTAAIDELAPHVRDLGAALSSETRIVARTDQAQESTNARACGQCMRRGILAMTALECIKKLDDAIVAIEKQTFPDNIPHSLMRAISNCASVRFDVACKALDSRLPEIAQDDKVKVQS